MNDEERLKHAEIWINLHIQKLRNQYPDEWIAVIDSRVVGHNKDSEMLSVQLAESGDSFAYQVFIHKQEAVNLWNKINRALGGEI